MTEPPRPPGDGNAGTPSDPTAPLPSGGDPASAFPPPPPYDPTGPGPGPGPGAGAYPPPAYGGYPQQPTSGAAGQPGSGAGAYPPPGSGAGGYPPGGGAPPPYGYDKAPGFGGPGPGGPGYGAHPTSDDRTWALLTHFGGAAAMFFSGGWLGWVPPLIAMVAKGNHSPLVRAHAVAALNFQLLWSVIAVVITIVSTCLTVFIVGFIMYGLLVIPWLVGTICGVIAGVKAANGEPYRYPASPNWVK